jgi:cyclophilin family peptidyl-prolyl cis-trans isomerase
MIQGGDPSGSGAGTGYALKMNLLTLSLTKVVFWLWPTLVQLQFKSIFITHKDTPWLNGKHTIFGM